MSELNPNCPCTNAGCERHGNCTACRASHHADHPHEAKPFCERESSPKA